MSKVRDLDNVHLFPVLPYFAVIYGAIQIAPIANQAGNYNICAEGLIAGYEKKEISTTTITLGTDIVYKRESAKDIKICLCNHLNHIQLKQNLGC